MGPVVGRPIRVVMLGGGSYLSQGAVDVLARLADEAMVDLAAVLLESEGSSTLAMVRDLWRRRGWLAGPVLARMVVEEATRTLRAPRRALTLRRRVRSLAPLVAHVPNLHAADVRERLRALQPDLGLVYGGPILKPELFEIPRFGCLGIHHGRLPTYRGKKTTFWEVVAGEPCAGVVIQRIGRGLDTGAIVLQGEVPIGSRSYGTVWREIEALGVELMVRAVLEVASGEATPRPQVGEKGPLYRDPSLRDLVRYEWRRVTRRR